MPVVNRGSIGECDYHAYSWKHNKTHSSWNHARYYYYYYYYSIDIDIMYMYIATYGGEILQLFLQYDNVEVSCI